ncbi:MAG: hypothetical protein HYV96_16345 [Opitutae bacterium]|nr:hypothetical protein [Opitutae bacterium]
MKIEKTGLFFRALVAGETEFRPGKDGKDGASYVTPCAAGKSFGDAVQKVNSAADLVDRRGNPIKRYKVGDFIEGEIEPRYENNGGGNFKRVVERWTFTTFASETPSKPALATGGK